MKDKGGEVIWNFELFLMRIVFYVSEEQFRMKTRVCFISDSSAYCCYCS